MMLLARHEVDASVTYIILLMQDWLNGIESRGLVQTTEKNLTSPSTYIATAFSATLFTAAVTLLVRPR